MTRLGDLERAVMEMLWTMSSESPGATFTARDVSATLPNHAYTTVLTVLDRLGRKGLVDRIRDGKAHHYRPTGSRESYTAEVMHEALATTSDRKAALVYFAQTVSAEELMVLRDALVHREEPRRKGSAS